MKVLIIDSIRASLDFAMDCMSAGHEVKVWFPLHAYFPVHVGEGYISRVQDWKKWMKWADLIIICDNAKYIQEFEPYYQEGYPIFGTNEAGGRMELDRQNGIDILKRSGIKTIPHQTFDNYDDAAEHVRKTKKAYACKPMGDVAKELSYVSKTPDDMLFKLSTFKKLSKIKDEFILQEKVAGIEMAVGGWFGPGGWSRYICENFEEKKLMNDGLGVNTGEQGTTLRYTESSKLFDEVLEPVGDYLHAIGYVGYVDMNVIVTEDGFPGPMEFTTRFGYPCWLIQQYLHKGDPVNWMADLLEGRDTLKVYDGTAVGVVVSHGDYPKCKAVGDEVEGFPLFGLTKKVRESFYFCDVKNGSVERLVGGSFKMVQQPVTAGSYIGIARGRGANVEEARCEAYETAKAIDLPSNKMYRTDIGKRLEKELPKLHKMGYAKGLNYE